MCNTYTLTQVWVNSRSFGSKIGVHVNSDRLNLRTWYAVFGGKNGRN